jgi:hypothetical protein
MVFDLLKHSSLFGLLGMLVSISTLGVALVYAIRPSEHRLALIRPLSLAAIFGGLSSFAVGVASIFRGISASASLTPVSWNAIAAGAAESLLGLFIAFSCLTIAWLLVTVGMVRS